MAQFFPPRRLSVFVGVRGLAGVGARRRLVEAEQNRLAAHRAHDLEAPLRAVGQAAGGIVRLGGEVDLVEPVARQLDSLAFRPAVAGQAEERSEEHTSELQSLMRISYAVFCLKKKHAESKT